MSKWTDNIEIYSEWEPLSTQWFYRAEERSFGKISESGKSAKSRKIPLIRHTIQAAKSIHNRPRQPAARNTGIHVSQQSDLSQIRQSPVCIFSRMSVELRANTTALDEGSRRNTVTEILSHPYVTPADYTVGGLRIDSCELVNGESLTSRWKQSISFVHHMGFEQVSQVSPVSWKKICDTSFLTYS